MTKRRRRKTAQPLRKVEWRLLALDISSICVGYAVFENGELEDHGKFVTEGKDHGARLLSFQKWLYGMLKKLKPTDVAVELPYPGRSRNSYGVLQMYYGVLLEEYYHYFKAELPSSSKIPSSQIKRKMNVKSGRSYEDNKRRMVERINEEYGLSLTFVANDRTKRRSQDDVADAIAVGHVWQMLVSGDSDSDE